MWLHLLYLLAQFICIIAFDNFNLRHKQFIGYGSSAVHRFRSPSASSPSEDSESDYFKLLERDGNSLLVGARNTVYNLSMETMKIQHVLEWAPQEQVKEDCFKKGKTRFECHNFIRVMVRQSNGRSLICGTHAYSPKCREYAYSVEDKSLQQRRQFDGQAISPYDPRHNSTAVYIPETKEIYAGTVSDFAGNDALIYRKPLSGSNEGIRTQRDDVKVLDSPNFVGSFAYGEHVYFWYREWASETTDQDRQIYARVARVCKSDRGGGAPAEPERWTSFVKARLNCSIPSNTPFYFNELQAVTDPIKLSDGLDVVYAVFNTPKSSVRMSAVCAFNMKTIQSVFDHGDFKVQENAQSLWVPHRYSKTYRKLYTPRPGSCVPDSTRLDDKIVHFITRYPLMHQAIPAISPHPIYVQGPERAQLTQIAVVPKLRSASGKYFNALYLGTTDGHVFKAVEFEDGSVSIVELVQIFSRKLPIVNLLSASDQLIVVSADEIAAVALQHCKEQTTCSGCVRLQDGHCSWDLASSKCVAETRGSSSFVQSLWTGKSEQCPDGGADLDYFIGDGRSTERATGVEFQQAQTSTSKLVLIVLVTLVAASVGGFLAGYRVSRWRLTHETLRHSSGSSTGSDYDSYGRARLTRHDSLTATKMDHVYGNPPCRDVVSLVLTMPQNGGSVVKSSISGNGSAVTTPKTPAEKNLVASFNNGTLPRDYKVKKVYL